MKKATIILAIFIISMSSLFALNDYERGYLQGYEDALAGKNNVVQDEIDSYTGIWIQKHYVDEAGNPKKSGYIGTNWQKGTYSSSFVSSGTLVWYFIIDKQGVAFKIFENSDTDPLKGKGTEKDKYTLTIQTASGEIFNYSGINYSDRIWYIDDKHDLMTNLNSGSVKLTITSESVPTKYNLGSFDGTGLEAAYVQMFGKNF